MEKLFSQVAVDTPIVRAATYTEYMFGKASLSCSISFVAVSKDESGASFFRRKLAPTLTSAAEHLTATAVDQLEALQLPVT